jgi:hypothetical protein
MLKTIPSITFTGIFTAFSIGAGAIVPVTVLLLAVLAMVIALDEHQHEWNHR